MIYLIKDREYLKIGYTKNIDSRMSNYRTHNPHFELLAYKEGLKQDESKLHKLCSNYKHTTEWFHYNDEILNIFSSYVSIFDSMWQDTKECLDVLINKIVQLINENSDALFEPFHNYWPSIDAKIIDFFYTVRGHQLNTEQELYKNFYDSYRNSYIGFPNVQIDYTEYIIEKRIPLIQFLYKNNYIDKDVYIKVLTQLNNHCLKHQDLLLQNAHDLLGQINNWRVKVEEKLVTLQEKIPIYKNHISQKFESWITE